MKIASYLGKFVDECKRRITHREYLTWIEYIMLEAGITDENKAAPSSHSLKKKFEAPEWAEYKRRGMSHSQAMWMGFCGLGPDGKPVEGAKKPMVNRNIPDHPMNRPRKK
jgi:hypothetical protein